MKSSLEFTMLQMEQADREASKMLQNPEQDQFEGFQPRVETLAELQDLWKPVLEDPKPDILKQTQTLRKIENPATSRPSLQDPPKQDSAPHSFSSSELPVLHVSRQSPSEEKTSDIVELAFHEKLAEGGMGQVYLANQVALRRDVVVKVSHTGEDEEKTAIRLLQESRLTGLLEHPNIVPVYQLGQDSQGQPMLVMKHIEGQPWSDIISQEAPGPQSPTGEVSSLERHIRILIQVCNAVAFAHNKNIIHRDLKPENIMIGAFGEVYVLDWGLAVSLNEQDRGKLPTVSEIKGVAGTPAYMAPEMARGQNDVLGERTDVYLLGGILHELITGSPPHSKGTLLESLFSIYRSEPVEYGEEIPKLLVSICHKSMSQKPEDRYANIQEFRMALLDYLQHKESLTISVRSKNLLRSLESLLQQNPNDDRKLYNQYSRCHFGLQHALEIWPDNTEAQDTLKQLLELMFEHEIKQENTKAATRWLAEFSDPPVHLQEQLNELKQRLHQKQKHLERLAYESDISVGANARRIVTLLIGALWGGLPLLMHALKSMNWYKPSHLDFILMNTAFGFILTASIFIGRKHLLKNQANRQVVKLLFLLMVVFIVQRIAVLAIELSLQKSAILELVIFFNFIGVLGIFYDSRMFHPASLYLLALCSALFWPPYTFVFMACAHFFGMITLAWIWSAEKTTAPQEGSTLMTQSASERN